jgi:ABC-2 type transport system permease protein
MNALQLYARYASISIRGQLQYRASAIMQAVGHFLLTGIEFIGTWALFDRFGQLSGWTLPEIALFYGIINVTWSIADTITRGLDQFASTLKAGDFDRVLLRPRSTVLQLMGQELPARRAGRFVQGALVLGYAFHALPMQAPVAQSLMLVLAILCGVCLFVGLLLLQATSAFWTTETLEIWNAFTYGGVFMSQYPLPIYRSWFRKLFTYAIPLACISYFPGLAILARSDPLGTPPIFHWLAPLAGPVFLFVALQIWKIGVRRYRSTGS